MQNVCNHGYIFEGRFSYILLKECIDVMIWIVRDNIKNQFIFYLKSLA